MTAPTTSSDPIRIHQRSYDTEAFDLGDGTMRITGRLTDTKPHGLALVDGEPLVIHAMTVEMIVAVDGFEILDIKASMHVNPYDTCPGIVAAYEQLRGTSIARGYSRRVKELFGGPNGCSHIGALLIALGPVAVQASWSMVDLHHSVDELLAAQDESTDDDKSRRMHLNLDTCHVWRADGAQMVALRSGRSADRPMWETERVAELTQR